MLPSSLPRHPREETNPEDNPSSLPRHLAVTNKVKRLLTLSRVCSEELDFRDFGSSRGQRSESKYASNVGRTLPVIPSQYLSRVPLGHPTLTFKDTRWFRFLPTSATRRSHSRWYTRDGSTETHQWNELKRNILVSPRW